MKRQIHLIEAPSILGLKPTGVDRLPETLKQAGFVHGRYRDAMTFDSPPYNPMRDPDTHLLNGPAIAEYSVRVADVVCQRVNKEQFTVVLGGDCSVLLGAMLGLKQAGPRQAGSRQTGRYGLVHIDAHADFYQPEAELNGEVASMDLAIVSGRGPDILTDINGQRPYVADEHIVQIGQRDAEEAEETGSQRIQDTPIRVYDLATVRVLGIMTVAGAVIDYLNTWDVDGFWIHFDADVLADDLMPAVDYRLPGGLTFDECIYLLQTLTHSTKAVGMTVTIFNPNMDPDRSLARQLADCLNDGLRAI